MKLLLAIGAAAFIMSCHPVGTKNSGALLPDTISISRPSYELKYLSTWKIDSSDADFNIDTYFSIDAPVEDGTSVFFIFNVPVNEDNQVKAQVNAHLKKVMKNGTVTYFDHFGKFEGRGALIDGKMMGLWQGKTKIFCHSGDSTSFLVVSQYLVSDSAKVLPGFNL